MRWLPFSTSVSPSTTRAAPSRTGAPGAAATGDETAERAASAPPQGDTKSIAASAALANERCSVRGTARGGSTGAAATGAVRRRSQQLGLVARAVASAQPTGTSAMAHCYNEAMHGRCRRRSRSEGSVMSWRCLAAALTGRVFERAGLAQPRVACSALSPPAPRGQRSLPHACMHQPAAPPGTRAPSHQKTSSSIATHTHTQRGAHTHAARVPQAVPSRALRLRPRHRSSTCSLDTMRLRTSACSALISSSVSERSMLRYTTR
jgi:hypothetical protein